MFIEMNANEMAEIIEELNGYGVKTKYENGELQVTANNKQATFTDETRLNNWLVRNEIV